MCRILIILKVNFKDMPTHMIEGYMAPVVHDNEVNCLCICFTVHAMLLLVLLLLLLLVSVSVSVSE